jgi:capsular polysaccharide export protein
LLQHASFDGEELARATALRESIVTQGLSKYNVGDSRTALPSPPASRAVVLVPGQVEDDASIRLGTKSVCTNAALLQRAREARPGAFLLFKPHPDVVSGNRQGHVADPVRRNLADAVVLDAPLSACLAMADEVHTMTSLVGFEALLREIPVVTYGQPFYAGWGLTTDVEPCVRRTARRSLDELVAATLIRYPLYLHPDERVLTSPEAVVDYLRRGVEHGKPPVQMPWAKRQLMKARNAIRGVVLG